MQQQTNISELFQKAFSADKAKYIKKWLISWEYQDIRIKRKISYDSELPQNFYAFKGTEDLIKWMNWFEADYPDYFKNQQLSDLINKSEDNDKKIFSKLNLPFNFVNYDKRIGLHNAHDFMIPHLYPVPERYKIKRVLDFGAGYGRQANLWAANSKDISYIGVDGIPLSYCLQHIYYKNLDVPCYDYVESPANFCIDFKPNSIYHIPTWRFDLIADNSIDMVMCVQVLPELGSKLLKFALDEFKRVLKPGGMLYIRDHAYTWKPAHKTDVDEYLKENSFDIEYKAYIIDTKDIFGIPRLWRKEDAEVIQTRTMSLKKKMVQTLEDIDTITKGKLYKYKRKFIKK